MFKKIKYLNHRKKNLFKLDKYRKFIRSITQVSFFNKHITLVCDSTFLGGFSLSLLIKYFCSKVFQTYNYKDNFDFLLISIKNQSYLYNYKFEKLLNKSILLIN